MLQSVAGFNEKHTSRLKWEFCQQIAFRLEIQCQVTAWIYTCTYTCDLKPFSPQIAFGNTWRRLCLS